MLTQQPFSTHAYHHAATKSGDIAYREAGSGPATILVHGVLVNGHLWDPLIERLAGSRRCIAIDLLAHGATAAGVDQDLSFDAQAAMLAEFCAALNLEQVDIVANDSGGGIAQIFAARHPGLIRSLVLTDCDTHDNWPPKQAEPLHKLAKQAGVGPLGRRLLEDIAFARTSFALALSIRINYRPSIFEPGLSLCLSRRRRHATSNALSRPSTTSRRWRSRPCSANCRRRR